jgi:hypothetical protein
VPRNAKIAVICLLLIALFASGVGDAGARKHKHKRHKKQVAQVTSVASQISLDVINADGASGSVSAGRSACLGDRVVTLYQVNSGPSVPSSFPVASTYSRSDGSWSIQRPTASYEYYAVVSASQTDQFRCGEATSDHRSF